MAKSYKTKKKIISINIFYIYHNVKKIINIFQIIFWFYILLFTTSLGTVYYVIRAKYFKNMYIYIINKKQAKYSSSRLIEVAVDYSMYTVMLIYNTYIKYNKNIINIKCFYN